MNLAGHNCSLLLRLITAGIKISLFSLGTILTWIIKDRKGRIILPAYSSAFYEAIFFTYNKIHHRQ